VWCGVVCAGCCSRKHDPDGGDPEQQQQGSRESEKLLAVSMTKVIFGESKPPPGPVAVEMLQQRVTGLSEADAESLLRQHSNDLDQALRKAREQPAQERGGQG
jgi:hypothetical protein